MILHTRHRDIDTHHYIIYIYIYIYIYIFCIILKAPSLLGAVVVLVASYYLPRDYESKGAWCDGHNTVLVISALQTVFKLAGVAPTRMVIRPSSTG